MNRNRLIAIFCLLALSIGGAGGQALAQQPGSQSNDDGSAHSGDEFQLSKLLAQARSKRRFVFYLLPEARNPNLMKSAFSVTSAPNPIAPVTGTGTLGRLTKWSGFTSTNSGIADSSLYEDKFGKVGVGTDSPTSKLTVAGLIESRGVGGGVKFPDGTVQTTASVTVNQAVRSLNGLMGDVRLAAGPNITITPSGNTLTIAAAPNATTIVEPVQIQLRDESGEQSFTVPSGKRLVVEHVSGFLITNTVGAERAPLSLSTTVSGLSFFHLLVLEAHRSDSNTFYIDHSLRLYADPGTVVNATPVGGGQFRVVLSGHFVPVP